MTGVELAGVFIGVTLLALGVVATLASTLRLRGRSITLVMFGLWCALYGARLLALQPPVRAAVGGAPHRWAQFVALVTYAINVPLAIFVGSLIGVGWRRTIRWVVGVVSATPVRALGPMPRVLPGERLLAGERLMVCSVRVAFHIARCC
jgi:hypothetical protein